MSEPTLQEQMRALERAAQVLGRAMQTQIDALAAWAAAVGRAFARIVPQWELRVTDPGSRRAESPRALLRQMRDIVLHEFWMAAGEPERSPGARYVLRRGQR